MIMSNNETQTEAREEKSGKSASQRSALAPFKSFEDRFEQMEHFMNRMMGNFLPSDWMRPFQRQLAGGNELAEFRAPAIDLIERDDEIVLRAELPGIKKEDVSISLTADSITIQGQSRKEEAEEKGDYRRREISSSAFSRSMWLPAGINSEAAKAVFNDGILEVTLPKTPAAKRTTVPIE